MKFSAQPASVQKISLQSAPNPSLQWAICRHYGVWLLP